MPVFFFCIALDFKDVVQSYYAFVFCEFLTLLQKHLHLCACGCKRLCYCAVWDDLYLCACERDRSWPILVSLTMSFSAFQRHNGDILTMASVKHLSHRRFVVSFQLDSVQRTDQDLYRCVTQSPRGSGVSNFAELVVKGKHPFPFSLTVIIVFF